MIKDHDIKLQRIVIDVKSVQILYYVSSFCNYIYWKWLDAVMHNTIKIEEVVQP